MTKVLRRHLAVSIVSLALLASCTTTSSPEPMRTEGWQTNAASAAGAQPAPQIASGHKGKALAQHVVRGAIARTVDSDRNGEDAAATNHKAPGRRQLESRPRFSEVPSADAPPDEVAGWISRGRQQGKSGRALQRELDRTDFESGAEHRLYWSAGDFDGDDRDDLAVVFWAGCADDDCPNGHGWTVGVIWGDRTFSQLDTSPERRPRLLETTDLTGDGRPELGFTIESCGAHTCRNELAVFTGHRRSSFRRVLYLGGDATGVGSGAPQKVDLMREDVDLPRIVTRGGTVGSVGGGPFQRTWRDEWRWAGSDEGFELVETDWKSSDLRLHRLHDAIVRLKDGELDAAEARLEEVIQSDDLREFPESHRADPQREEAMREQLGATARFLLARIALERDEVELYARRLDDLMKQAPHSPATTAARRLREAVETGHDLRQACTLAATSFPDKPDDDWILDSHLLGYNAPMTFDGDRDKGLCAGL